MRDIQKEFVLESFDSKILNKISDDTVKNYLLNFYLKDSEGLKYILKEKIKEIDVDKIGSIFDSVGFISEAKSADLRKYYKKIENYFIKKKDFFEKFKHIPIEKIVNESPKYYSFIRIIEQLNTFITKDKDWLKKFVNSNKINFDFSAYSKWKAGQDFFKVKYDDTFSPSKWVNVIQDKLIEILGQLQILLYIEFYIDDYTFKKFLKSNVETDYKMKANFLKKSLPSEDLDLFFNVVDYLLKVNSDNDFSTNLLINTAVCMRAYKYIDDSNIFDILKRKEFYVKYYAECIRKMPKESRINLPSEEDIISVAELFLETVKDLTFTYREYKERLIEKFNKVKQKIK
ncbi:MAG TPA: hypothetical protein PLO89_07795 [Spirochaetota bacterium]|nr:hypothetical protein [Spirochaetota bacterium]